MISMLNSRMKGASLNLEEKCLIFFSVLSSLVTEMKFGIEATQLAGLQLKRLVGSSRILDHYYLILPIADSSTGLTSVPASSKTHWA